MAKCDKCGLTICADCLHEMAVEQGDTAEHETADGYMKHCDNCGDLCPECFEKEK
jgi:uncharacterized Zn finger protein